MSELDYYKLPKFIERITNGLEGPQTHIRIPNMCGNQIHNISFLDHCDELCTKHKTDRLRLLSVIQQKLNGDMVIRLNESPVFSGKIKQVLSEWGEDIDPVELFRCPNNCYDNTSFIDLKNLYQLHNDTLESLNVNADNLESNIYNAVESLRNDFHSCEDILRENLSQIETRQYEYEPKYRAILCDLSTRQKPFYLDGLMKSDEQVNMIQHVNRKVNRHIPDNISVIFLNIVLIPTLIAKEMERLRAELTTIMNQIEERKKILSDIMERIGPEEPLSVGFLKMLSDLSSVFTPDSDEDLPDDDDDDIKEDKIEKVMENIIDKQSSKSVDDKTSPQQGEKMYYLDMKHQNDSLRVNDSQEDDQITDSVTELSDVGNTESEMSFY